MNSLKNVLLASAVVCLCLSGALASSASANVIVGAGTIETSSATPPTVLGLVNLASTDAAGAIYNNTVNSTDPTQVNTVRTVGAIRLTTYTQVDGTQHDARFDSLNMSLVFAVEGTSTPQDPLGVTQLFRANRGRYALFTYTGGFNAANPQSWGAVTGTGATLALASPIAVWDLIPADNILDIFPGPGIFNVTKNLVNEVGVNTQNPTLVQGTFLAGETATYGGPTEIAGNDFWTTTHIFGSLPPNYLETAAIRLSESLTLTPNLNFISGGAGTDGFEALNVIANTLGGLPFFATDMGTAASEFDPVSALNPTGSDNVFTGGVNIGFGLQAIPEPSTYAIFGLILGGAGLVGAFRRRRARAA
jgi:hypothetical protein